MRHSIIYRLEIEIEDRSGADPEDLELLVEDTLREGLPDSLDVRVVSFEEVEDENY